MRVLTLFTTMIALAGCATMRAGHDTSLWREPLARGDSVLALSQRWSADSAVPLYRASLAAGGGAPAHAALADAARAHGELSYLARARGDIATAVREMELGVAAFPEDDITTLGLATMLLNAGDARRALEIVERAISVDTMAVGFGGLPVQLLHAWALQGVHDSLAARAAFARAEANLLAQARAGRDQSRHLAGLYALQGRSAEAREWFQRAVERGYRQYGRPEMTDALYASMAGDSAFAAALEQSRRSTRDRRRAMGLPD